VDAAGAFLAQVEQNQPQSPFFQALSNAGVVAAIANMRRLAVLHDARGK
jgi:hypothetical protein